MKPRCVESLAQAHDHSTYGGKAANLARMLCAELAVPSGYVIGVHAFRAQLTRLAIEPCSESLIAALRESDEVGARTAAAQLRQALLDNPLDPKLMESLRSIIVTGERYAVRSSAPGEDAAEASFAGQFDSVLDCTSVEAVSAAVCRVWASLFGDRALKYAAHRKQLPHGMAVVIQRQVDATISGVMFTRDPRPQHTESLLVEYCAGLGDRLVSGELAPGRLRIDRVDATVSVEQGADRQGAADLIVSESASALLTIAKQLETLFGGPLDIEWSLDASGRVIVLQARPITAHSSHESAVIWSNANIAENFPEPVCPLLQSFVGRGYSAYFRALGRAFGISRQRMTAMADALDQIVGAHAGRLYYNLTNIHTVIHLAPGGRWLTRFFNQFTGAEDFPVPRQLARHKVRKWIEAVSVAIHVIWRYLCVDKELRTFEQDVDAYALVSRPEDLRRKDATELADLMRRFLHIRFERWTGGALSDTSAMVCYGVLKLLLREIPDINANDLLKGLPHLASAVPVERLWDLSRMLRANATLHAFVQQESAEVIRMRLEAGDYPDFGAALKNYFDRWGFRYSGELMLSRPTPQEDPLPVLRLLKRYAEMNGHGPAEVSERQARARLEATRQARQRLSLLRAVALGLMLKAAHGAICLRERARMKQALLYTRLRHVALALGDVFVRQGLLARRDDVLYLHIDEAMSLGQGTAGGDVSGMMRNVAAARRAEMDACVTCRPPDRFVLSAGARWQATDGAASPTSVVNDGVFIGTGACGGQSCGTAAVVLDVADIDRIRDDQILVTRQTDPGWAAVFFMIKGLVIERGGMLSHGAIIAREYGIPAVVGVRDATRLIKDGQLLRVCGDEGRVERVRG